MNLVKNKLRVVHYPQMGVHSHFAVEVLNEREAYLIEQALANQHLFLYTTDIIPDYANVIEVEMFEGGEWVAYYNSEEHMDWEDFVEYYEDYLVTGKN
jgi:hypothetical protein